MGDRLGRRPACHGWFVDRRILGRSCHLSASNKAGTIQYDPIILLAWKAGSMGRYCLVADDSETWHQEQKEGDKRADYIGWIFCIFDIGQAHLASLNAPDHPYGTR